MSYELIETIEVGAGGAASIEFTSIPQDGVDLLLVVSVRNSGAGQTIKAQTLQINGSIYNGSALYLQGTGSATGSGATAYLLIGSMQDTSATANTFTNKSIYISNYTSTADKSMSVDSTAENNATLGLQEIVAGTITVTTINSIGVAGGYTQYSTISLYKIS